MTNTTAIPPPTIDNYKKRETAQSKRTHGGSRNDHVTCTVQEPDHPLISIITIVFNGQQTLEHTILSIQSQTYSNIEYIIIDGGSTDGTLDLIRQYDRQINYWISEPDRGISDAFNKGISAAHGEIIGMLNSDDWYEKDAVEIAVEKLKDSGADIVYGDLRTWDNDAKSEIVSADHELLDKEMSLNHPAVFVARSAYERIGLYRTDFRFAMDYEWLLRAKKAGLKFSSANRCLTNMRLEGTTNINWLAPLKEEVRAKNLITPKATNTIFYLYKTAKGFTRRILERTGFGFLVRFFHANVSSVRKMKAKD